MGLDSLGDRQKGYEMAEAGRKLLPGLPVMIRLDGRGFSRFTKDLPRPFCPEMHQLMVEVTKTLVQEAHALIGYTQSDEISLILHKEEIGSEVFFDGRISKLTSVLAGLASARMQQLMPELLPSKVGTLPTFDCRVWNVPSKDEATNAVLWRVRDAIKNSVSMAAFTVYSPKQLFKKNQDEQLEMLKEKGIDWNAYPDWFKSGTFVRRVAVEQEPSQELLEKLKDLNCKIPEKIVRHEFIVGPQHGFAKAVNRTGFIFNGQALKYEV